MRTIFKSPLNHIGGARRRKSVVPFSPSGGRDQPKSIYDELMATVKQAEMYPSSDQEMDANSTGSFCWKASNSTNDSVCSEQDDAFEVVKPEIHIKQDFHSHSKNSKKKHPANLQQINDDIWEVNGIHSQKFSISKDSFEVVKPVFFPKHDSNSRSPYAEKHPASLDSLNDDIFEINGLDAQKFELVHQVYAGSSGQHLDGSNNSNSNSLSQANQKYQSGRELKNKTSQSIAFLPRARIPSTNDTICEIPHTD